MQSNRILGLVEEGSAVVIKRWSGEYGRGLPCRIVLVRGAFGVVSLIGYRSGGQYSDNRKYGLSQSPLPQNSSPRLRSFAKEITLRGERSHEYPRFVKDPPTDQLDDNCPAIGRDYHPHHKPPTIEDNHLWS